MDNTPVKFSPDGARLLYMLDGKTVRIRPISGGAAFAVTPAMAAIARVDWAPDGNGILISGADADGQTGLYRVDLSGNATSFVAPFPAIGHSESAKGSTPAIPWSMTTSFTVWIGARTIAI
jgi:20S proteasome alpha/beta subunit